MTIDPTRSLDIRARTAEAAAEIAERNRGEQASKRSGRTDQVEISDAARALAEQDGTDGMPVTQARLAEVQERLDSGFYERADTIEDVARRLLDSGDL